MTHQDFHTVAAKLIRDMLRRSESLGLDRDGQHLFDVAQRLNIRYSLLQEFVQLGSAWPPQFARLPGGALQEQNPSGTLSQTGTWRA